MERFNDFTYYAKQHYENAINIGFNRSSSQNLIGKCENNPALVQKLKRYAKHRLNLVRGGADFQIITVDGETYPLGFGEIRVIARDGTVYAAPDLVIAWVADGSYVPPKSFENAVLYGLDPDGDDYRRYESRYIKELFWGASDEDIEAVRQVSVLMENNDFPGLKRYLETDDKKINMVTQNGTLLNGALLLKNEEIADYLLGKSISLTMLSGIELLTAVEKGMVTMVQRLMSLNIPIRTDIPRNNPLFWAIAKNRNDVAKYLYDSYKNLVMTYNVGAIQNCNILQWTKLCDNQEFFDYLTKTY